MKKFNKSTKLAVALGAGAVAVATSGVAYAYIAGGASGSTSGSAGVTSTNPFSNVTLSGTPSTTGLVPGTAKNITVTIKNPNNFSVGYPAFTVTASYDTANASLTCTAAKAPISGSAPVSAGTLVANGTTTVDVPVTLGDAGTGVDQSACLGASVPLAFTIS